MRKCFTNLTFGTGKISHEEKNGGQKVFRKMVKSFMEIHWMRIYSNCFFGEDGKSIQIDHILKPIFSSEWPDSRRHEPHAELRNQNETF